MVPGIDVNSRGQWGSRKNQFQYTGRSALGVDKAGNLIYVAGRQMNLHIIADALVGAGAIRGMELDIHGGLQSFSSWRPSRGGSVRPTKLLPSMTRSARRYLKPDQRDFFYITQR